MKDNPQQFFDKFIDECKFSRRLRPETMRGYSSVWKTFLTIVPEVDSISNLIPSMMNEFFKRVQTRERLVGKNTIKSGVRDSTIKTYWNKLNCFFEWLVINKHIIKNPLSDIKLPQPVYDDSRALEDSDVQKIYASIVLHSKNSLITRRDILMVSILFFCGLRKGEFISLHVNDIDMEKEMLTVRGETSKSKKIRYIPMHKTLIFHLREYLTERKKRGYKTEYILVSNNSDNGLTLNGLKHWVKRLNDLSGVKFHLHCFRHTFACNLAKQNVGLIKIQKLMGHTDPKMTASYLWSIMPEDLKDDIDKLSI